MGKGFLAQNAARVSKEQTKLGLILCVCMAVAFAGLMIIDMVSDEDVLSALPVPAYAFIIVFLLLLLLLLIQNFRNKQRAYDNLIVHGGETSKEETGHAIDGEAAQGILVDEYADYGKQRGDRFVLLPSYLLLCTGRNVTVIPVGKIFWVCAQVGIKGHSDYIVQLRVFAENKLYGVIGADVNHFKMIEDKIQRYIPNIFNRYDTFDLSHKLEEVFTKDYSHFLEFYRQHKQEFEAE